MAVTVTASPTPNPNSVKFTVDKQLVAKGSLSYNSAADAEADPVGKALFALPGVASVFCMADFLTVTADGSSDWGTLEPQIIKALQDNIPS